MSEHKSDVPGNKPWPVMVLAHNEERHIERCLDSIFAAESGAHFEVYVMANGCTDRTEEIARRYRKKHADVHVVSIPLGDKCNAWNIFIHETVPSNCPGRGVYFFMDGDARAVPGSFSVMAQALQEKPYAHAASAVPASGRSAREDGRQLLQEHGLVANLYALRGTFVERLHDKNVRIPIRLEGDDGLLGALIKWDLAPDRNAFDHERIVPCSDAQFAFDPISPMRLADWRAYWKRLVRYGRRRYEFEILGPRLKKQGLSGLPTDITHAYDDSHQLTLAWNGFYTFTNWLALRQMRSVGKKLRSN